MKKALITLCTVATTLVAGSALASAGATGERGYRNGLYNNAPRLNTWDTSQSAMTPYNKDNSDDVIIRQDQSTTQPQVDDTQSTIQAPASVN
ncbi:hypothetical protein [Silvimonas soli]|uniref:hypothetical protein n=1 Tax=Silvimonas soli TaxID=2980100 RepID=UPI0024B3693A|nr:hypothetical protein [Silvimonas soli]